MINMYINSDISNDKLKIIPVNRDIKDEIIAKLKFICIMFFEKKFNGTNWHSDHMYSKFIRYLDRKFPNEIKVSRITFKIYYSTIPINLSNIWKPIEKEFINDFNIMTSSSTK